MDPDRGGSGSGGGTDAPAPSVHGSPVGPPVGPRPPERGNGRAFVAATGLFLALLFLSAASAAAQSLYSAAGLGLPSHAIDGRARALGSFGIGLSGSSIQLNDPAAAGLLGVPRATIVAQPSWVDYERADESGEFRGNRFPAIAMGYPLGGGLATVHFSTFFEQHYRAERDVVVELGPESREARESFDQEGAVSQIHLGFSRALLDGRVALGVLVGRYAGSLGTLLTRDFTVHDSTSTLSPYRLVESWSYSGWTGTLGASVEVGSVLRFAASAAWSGRLRAGASESTSADDRSWDLPTRYRSGFSLAVSSGLQLTASAVYADWRASSGLPSDVTVGSSLGYGVGIELSRARLLGRAAPLRIGFRSVQLPFGFTDPGSGGGLRTDGVDPAVETTLSAGFGFPLAGSEEVTLASADFAIERGHRRDLVLSERFWRATFSLSVSGF